MYDVVLISLAHEKRFRIFDNLERMQQTGKCEGIDAARQV